ncbi:FecR family protein [Burkholderiaceae bacterium UC74_6]
MSPGEAAAVWAARLDRGSLSQSEEAEFAEWVADPANDEALSRAHEALHVFDADRLTDPNLRALRQAALKAAPARRRQPLYLVASVAAVMIGATFVFARLQQVNSSSAPTVVAASATGPQAAAEVPPPPIEYSSEIGKRRTVSLSDGSTITLNTNSRVAVSFTEGRRLIHLMRGQALFEVAHNPQRPFMVFAGDRRVTALGTVFEVRSEPSRMQVVLVQGAVVVDRGDRTGNAASSAAEKPVLLAPGQAFVAAGGQQRVSKIDVRRELLWRDGFVEFDDESLGRAVQEFNRYASQPIELSPDGVADLRVSGLFRTDDPRRFVDTIRELLSIEVHPTERGGVRLSLAKP